MSLLLDRIEREGDVLTLDHGSVGIFDPLLALKVDLANSERLEIKPLGSSRSGRRAGRQPMSWREIRSLLLEQNRRLNAPRHLEALHARMRAQFAAQAGRETDLTRFVARAASRALIPLIIDGPADEEQVLAADQEEKFGRLLDVSAGPAPFSRRVSGRVKQWRAGRVIARHLRERRRGREPERDDFAHTLLALTDRIGAMRVSYLVMTLLTAASSAPGAVAACLLYEMVGRPDWRARIRVEIGALAAGEIYSTPAHKLPQTIRFIKEVLRLWSFPLVTRRIAAGDTQVEGVSIEQGRTYDLSAYVMHHSRRYWEDPERFDPDRWLSRKAAAKGTYVPFGFGPRMCVGAAIGHSQLILLCELAACAFDFELAPASRPSIAIDDMAVPIDFIGTVKPLSEQ